MSKKNNILHFAIAVIFLFQSCICDKSLQPPVSFCYWKTHLDFKSSEINLAKEVGVNHLYVRYFDVDWNEPLKMAVPIAVVNHHYYLNLPANHITPSIFITNLALEKTANKQIPLLAQKISDKIKYLNKNMKRDYINGIGEKFIDWEKYDYNPPDSLLTQRDTLESIAKREWKANFDEVLIDCDWTEKNRNKFFRFIDEIKRNFPDKTITATLRLWQYRHSKKAGIPPSHRCLLMCYNMNSPREFSSRNSIASVADLKPYLENDAYPLPFDIALPVFNWAALYRGGKFKQLINGFSETILEKDTATYKKIEKHTFMYRRDTVFGNTYIRNGDILKTEYVDKKELQGMIKILSSLKKDEKQRVTFFDWDTLQIKYYGKESFKNYTGTFD